MSDSVLPINISTPDLKELRLSGAIDNEIYYIYKDVACYYSFEPIMAQFNKNIGKGILPTPG